MESFDGKTSREEGKALGRNNEAKRINGVDLAEIYDDKGDKD